MLSTLLPPPSVLKPAARLLDGFPLIRSCDVAETTERMGRIFSPHRLELRGPAGTLRVRHNQVRLGEVALNTLCYGSEVMIDPGCRGDFYLVQLPLAGEAHILTEGREVRVNPEVLSVLQPNTSCRMVWSADCAMLLLQVPSHVVSQRARQWGLDDPPRFALTRSRRDPAVAAWWQAVLDLAVNLDRFGDAWVRHPAAWMAMEDFLLSAFTSLLRESDPTPDRRAAQSGSADAGAGADESLDRRVLRRAQEFVRAHPDRAVRVADMAAHACVCPRTLEAVFKRMGEPVPGLWARSHRLQRVHEALLEATRSGRSAGRSGQVTDVALAHGFSHMGRFAAQYRARFGCSPSETLAAGLARRSPESQA